MVKFFAETGIESRINFRKMFNNINDINRNINKYKHYSNVYASIYWFRETEQKFNLITGKKARIGPNYETAIIDKVSLDLDAYQKSKKGNKDFEYYTEKALEDVRKVEDWCEKKDLMRHFSFSGGGFNYTFSAKGEPLKLRDFELKLSNELDINIDISTIGDTSRMIRIINSFNFKPHRLCYCISLRKKELYLPYEKIKKLAKNPRFGKSFIYGSETYDFSSCKIDKSKIKLKLLKVNILEAKKLDANEILINYGWEVDDFCDSIKSILSLGHKGNRLRFELLNYLKTIVKSSPEDSIRILVALLGNEGIHSAIEGQARHVFGSKKQFNPEWLLKQLGYCPLDCNKCMNYKNIVKESKRILKWKQKKK